MSEFPLKIRVCECGAVGTALGASGPLTRCGRDARGNMKGYCPTREVEVAPVARLGDDVEITFTCHPDPDAGRLKGTT